jgi:hypothetical protein
MQFKSIAIALLTLGASLPGATAVNPVWNDVLKVWDIGNVPWKPLDKKEPFSNMGSCGPKIKEGGYACGRFGPGLGRFPRVIYFCQNGKLRKHETCRRESKNNMCVRNSRRKGKAFYPFEAADSLVCVKSKDALKP